MPIIKRTDGNIWPILDGLLEAGFDGIHPIQPQCMDIKQVKDMIRKAAPGGGYILSSSNSVHPGCKGENVVAMFEAAKKYGTYPISI